MDTFQDCLPIIEDALARIGDIVFGDCPGGADQTTEPFHPAESCLNVIVETCGTSRYLFNYVVEKFVELYGMDLTDGLIRVLNENSSISPAQARRSPEMQRKLDLAFCACYALSLIYKKEDRMDALKELADLENRRYARCFQAYPLRCEIRSRYNKRIGNYTQALMDDETALELLKARDIFNCGPAISYASTVCRMLEQGTFVNSHQKNLADAYIQEAIEFNPTYSKYYYLRAKLRFYSHLYSGDRGAFFNACTQANADLLTARKLLDPTSEHFLGEEKLYLDLMEKIHAKTSLFEHFTPEEILEMKRKILDSEDPVLCAPPLPGVEAFPDQKYIFICYSTRDYKSVYCDLVELYRRRVPFIYDKGLKKGMDWDKQVAKRLTDPNCIGAIFFLSRNTVLSGAIEEEISFVRDKHLSTYQLLPTYICVNLEGKVPPSSILIRTVQAHTEEELAQNHVNDARMRIFLEAFPDKCIFAAKGPEPDSVSHMDEVYSAICDTFPMLDLPAKFEE